MSFLDVLLLFGLPLAIYFGLLIWSGKKAPRQGWKKMASSAVDPPQMTKAQQEIAALNRMSSNLRGPPPVAPITVGRGMFNLPARWSIEYVDAYGVVTERVIQVQHLDLRAMEIEAFCETRRALRTFKVRNIKQASDPRTGAGVSVKAYVEQVRTARRASRSDFR